MGEPALVDPMSSCCAEVAASTESIQLAVLFSSGLAISAGHCVGMCGPIVTAFSFRQREQGRAGVALVSALLRYHAGRLTAYLALGLVLGVLALGGTRLGPGTQGGATLVVGLLMLGMGLTLVGILPTWRARVIRGLSARVGCGIARLLGARTAAGQFGLGFVNGLLPCGPVAAVALAAAAAAAAGRPGLAALAMLAYGLGTVPTLLALGAGANWIGPRLRLRIFRLGHVFLLFLAVQLVARGAAALGWVPHLGLGNLMLW